jgi:hypothetical protein
MPNGVKKDTFLAANTDSKLSILYDIQLTTMEAIKDLRCMDTKINDHCTAQKNECDQRFRKLERHYIWILGGVAALSVIASIAGPTLLKHILG